MLEQFKGCWLSFSTLKDLSPAAATALAVARGDKGLCLDGLKTLPADTARALGSFKGPAVFDGITTLSPPEAAALATFEANTLSLDGLTAISDEAAESLAGFKGWSISLSGLKMLSAKVARSLAAFESAAGYKGSAQLRLNGLETLSPEAAEALAGFCRCGKKGRLELCGLEEISDEAAEAMAGFAGDSVLMTGLTSLSPRAAAAFGKMRLEGHLGLHGVTMLSAEAAQGLAATKADFLSLHGLHTLSAETAAALARYQGCGPGLSGIDSLTPAVAKAFVDSRNPSLPLLLDGVTAIDSPEAVEVARHLAAFKGWLSLSGLKRISPKALEALIEKEDIAIPDIATLELITEPDGSPTDDFVIPKGFSKRQD